MQRAISPAMRALLGRDGESSAPGVSMTVTSGSPSSSASRMPRRACRSAAGPSGLSRAVWCAGPGRRARTAARRAGSASRARRRPARPPRSRSARAVPWAPYRSRSRTPSRVRRRVQLHRLPDRPAATRPGSAAHGQRGRVGRVDEHRQGQVDQLGQVLGRHDGVDDALLGEVLGLLDAGRERPALERLEHLRARGSRRARPARRRSRARASPTTRRRRRWSGGAGARGRAARPRGGPSPPARSRPSRRTPACPPACGCRRRRWSRAAAAPRRWPGGPRRRSAAAAAWPIDPPRKANSLTTKATGATAHQPAPGEHRLVGARPLGGGAQLVLVGRRSGR